MARKLVLPRVHVIVLCDDFKPSADENDVFHLYGVRTRIEAEAFPYSHPQLCVYIQLTGHPGRTTCEVIVLNPETDQEVLAAPSQTIELAGPLDVSPALFILKDCEFSAAGLYYIQVFCDSKLLGERPLL